MALSTITKKRFCHLRPLCVTLTNFSIYTKALSGSVGGGGGVVVYQYTRKKFAKPYTRFKKPLYTVHPKTLADPE